MVQINKFSTLFVGQSLIILQNVDSTNTFLKNALANSEPYRNGTVIMAVNQYAGRGQMNNVWQAKPGENLTFSLLFIPEGLRLNQQFNLNKAVSLALVEVLKYYLPNEKVAVKWPNDILVNEKKIGGVLIENLSYQTQIKQSIIGIGLNVNQSKFDQEIDHKVTSLKRLLNQEFSLVHVLDKICHQLEIRLLDINVLGFEKLHRDYLRTLFQYRQKAGYRHNGKFFVGEIIDVARDGKIIVDVVGDERYFDIKEIEFIF